MDLSVDKSLFPKRLRACMDSTGDSIYTMSDHIGMTATAISNYLTGRSYPKIPIMKALADVFGIDPLWLGGVEGTNKYDGVSPVKGMKRIPILGRVAAGIPITAVENIEGYEVTDAADKSHFCLRIKGDSMEDAHIPHGSIVYCVAATEIDVVSGDIAIILVDGEDATVKKIVMEDSGIYLIPANSNYTPKFYKKSEMKDIKILAKVIACKIDM